MPEQYNTPISLANVCDGGLEQAFLSVLPQVISSMKKGQKASISITVEFERPATMDTIVNVGYKVTPKYPTTKNASTAQIGENGELKVERPTEKVAQLSLMSK